MKKLRKLGGLLAIVALTSWAMMPSPATAVALNEGSCDVRQTLTFSEELCCGCVGVGPEPEDGSVFCEQRDEGRGGTFYCSDEECPFNDHPCGLALD